MKGLIEPALFVVGDINDHKALIELFTDVDVVIHTVSNFRIVKGTDESYYQTNQKGTESALQVAQVCRVKRFIHTSTIGVHGNVKQTPAKEESPLNPGDLYQSTKLLAENACKAVAAQGKMEVVVVRPTSQYGPGDLRMLKMFRMIQNQRFLLIGRCRENFHAVYIDDLVRAYQCILKTPDLNGQVFFIGGERYLSLQEYIDSAARALGVKKPGLRVPYWPVHFAGWLCELICKPLGVEPPLHRRRVKFFKNNRAFDISRAERVLGYVPQVDLDEGMRRTVKWYRAQGLLD
ncbi:MAG: NAD-dependent epimerase/dehydratase family protein [Proteobacteria bacterium]|nr:NAD-dependent epimerase/dehydratase family protein [Pseudomonadota bacterium]